MPRRMYSLALISVVLASLLVGMALNGMTQRIDAGMPVRALDLVAIGAPFFGLVINLVFLLRWPPGSKGIFLGLKPE